MNTISKTEFYITPEGEIMIHDNQSVRTFIEEERQFTTLMYRTIEERYPEALKALAEIYSKSKANLVFFQYRVVHRFIRCNFGIYDSIYDIDSLGNFNFEEVSCPIRCECRYCNILCKPQFNSALSMRESEVLRLICDGFSSDDIANALGISSYTVPTHRRNIYRKLGMSSTSELIIYARDNHLYQK